jgi:tartrate dehydrogenase/decarboxylase / D-malate dehydrogenase
MSEQRKFKIAIIPGEGIGKEVIQEGQRVLEHIAELSGGKLSFEFDSFPWGCEYDMKHDRMMVADSLEQLNGCAANS